MNTLIKIATEDSEFVRFLKENNVYRAYLSAMSDKLSSDYQRETIANNRYYTRFTICKHYIIDGFPSYRARYDKYLNGTIYSNWFQINLNWIKTTAYKTAQP